MKQVLIIHGGDSFSSHEAYIQDLRERTLDYDRLKYHKSWKSWIAEQMVESDVLLPTFPNGFNASYDEWEVFFEKIVPFFQDDVRLVGHSLGAMFLTKYLQHNPLPSKVRQLILVAGRYESDDDDEIGTFGIDSATLLTKSAQEIHIFHSEDDPIVPFGEMSKFSKDLPNATVHTFTSRGHFNDSTFPELLELLQQK